MLEKCGFGGGAHRRHLFEHQALANFHENDPKAREIRELCEIEEVTDVGAQEVLECNVVSNLTASGRMRSSSVWQKSVQVKCVVGAR